MSPLPAWRLRMRSSSDEKAYWRLRSPNVYSLWYLALGQAAKLHSSSRNLLAILRDSSVFRKKNLKRDDGVPAARAPLGSFRLPLAFV
ncbi:hypothetical protein EVAR_55980_1 [Eumeta japonica]|uniref:Uncharacterized protein n=1 Tax=Eumeta variegata TaxID=151549 RepID=A0A4C1Y6C7_EUMVA|nr:hypothetical protein EVAR_55980_1 [Eumeta japonica]